MQQNTRNRRKPSIVMSRSDYERLERLADSATAGRMPEAADMLSSELERARVVSDRSVGADVVRMGSTVEFKPDNGPARTVTLGFPDEADISLGKISILTPIGTALIGLRPGQSITWEARDGRKHELHVIAVRQPESETLVEAEGEIAASAGQGA